MREEPWRVALVSSWEGPRRVPLSLLQLHRGPARRRGPWRRLQPRPTCTVSAVHKPAACGVSVQQPDWPAGSPSGADPPGSARPEGEPRAWYAVLRGASPPPLSG